MTDSTTEDGVLLYWLPLGAGDAVPCVRWNGRLFEALAARHGHREACDLFHSALEVCLDGDRFVIELAPAWSGGGDGRGVVAVGPVGLRPLGRSRFFRYEVRRWRGGVIPDASQVAGAPHRLVSTREGVSRLLDAVKDFPTLTWGRDELGTGDMWNSNSLISWVLARSGHDLSTVAPPKGGRAPGWNAGMVAAARRAIDEGTTVTGLPAIEG